MFCYQAIYGHENGDGPIQKQSPPSGQLLNQNGIHHSNNVVVVVVIIMFHTEHAGYKMAAFSSAARWTLNTMKRVG
jgi:hypothetical protein